MDPTTQGLEDIVHEIGVTSPLMAYAAGADDEAPVESFRQADAGDEFAVDSFDHAIFAALIAP
ncbi:MAG: hypothetical protein QOK25_3127 [Thermoleophilaceae bacterium]|jgi:hypothetical protein|nr:hypothetical protein [Thermoleophilaceae bacterium]